jgi:hypothetical protein
VNSAWRGCATPEGWKAMVLMTSPGNLPNHYRRFAEKHADMDDGRAWVFVGVPAKARATCPFHMKTSVCGRESKIRLGERVQ